MKHKVFLLGAAALFTLPSPSVASDQMNILADEAVRVNPKLKAMERQVEALKIKSRAQQTWMDPILSVEYSNFPIDTWSMNDSAMTGIQLKVTQTFPFPGKNQRKEAVALSEAEAANLEKRELAVQLRGAVKNGYLSLTLVRQLKTLTEEHLLAMDKLLATVRLRYEVGKGNQQDVLRLELLKEKLEDELEDFSQKDREITASINSVLHRDPRTKIETPTSLKSVAPISDLDSLVASAKKNRPILAALDEKVHTSHLAADQAAYERKPDFSVWIGYRFKAEAGMDDGTDFMSIGASLPIPFDYANSNNAKKDRYLALAGVTQQQKLSVEDEIGAEIEKNIAIWQRAYSQERNYEDVLIPQAIKTLESALLAYETDRADFFSIYSSELDLIQFERVIRKARVTTWQMKVEIEMLTGHAVEEVEQQNEITVTP